MFLNKTPGETQVWQQIEWNESYRQLQWERDDDDDDQCFGGVARATMTRVWLVPPLPALNNSGDGDQLQKQYARRKNE